MFAWLTQFGIQIWSKMIRTCLSLMGVRGSLFHSVISVFVPQIMLPAMIKAFSGTSVKQASVSKEAVSKILIFDRSIKWLECLTHVELLKSGFFRQVTSRYLSVDLQFVQARSLKAALTRSLWKSTLRYLTVGSWPWWTFSNLGFRVAGPVSD